MSGNIQVVIDALQGSLADLINLSLYGKQVHWNIRGEGFKDFHEHLDEIIDDLRIYSDDVAERIAAIGGSPDGRPQTSAAISKVAVPDAGVLKVSEARVYYEQQVQGVADRIKAGIGAVGDVDTLSGDLLVGIATGLEKQAWLLRAGNVK